MYCLVPIAPLGSTLSSGLANCDASIPSNVVTVWACAPRSANKRNERQNRRGAFAMREVFLKGGILGLVLFGRGGGRKDPKSQVTHCIAFRTLGQGLS